MSTLSQVLVPYNAELQAHAPSLSDVPSVQASGSRVGEAVFLSDVIFADSPDEAPASAVDAPLVACFPCFNPFHESSRVQLDVVQQVTGTSSIPHVVDRVRLAAQTKARQQEATRSGGFASKKNGAGSSSSSSSSWSQSTKPLRPTLSLQGPFSTVKQAHMNLAGTYDAESGTGEMAGDERRDLTVYDVPTCDNDCVTAVSSTGVEQEQSSKAFQQIRAFCERWDEFGLLLLALAPNAATRPVSPDLWKELRGVLSRSPFLDEALVATLLDATPGDGAPSIAGVSATELHARCKASIDTIKANLQALKKGADAKKAYDDFRRGVPCDASVFLGVHGSILRAAAREVITELSGDDVGNRVRTSFMSNQRGARDCIQFRTRVFLPHAGDYHAAAQFLLTPNSNSNSVLARMYDKIDSDSFEAEKQLVKEYAIKSRSYVMRPPAVRFYDGAGIVEEFGKNRVQPLATVSVVFHPQLRMIPGPLNSSLALESVVLLRGPEYASDITRRVAASATGGSAAAGSAADVRYFASYSHAPPDTEYVPPEPLHRPVLVRSPRRSLSKLDTEPSNKRPRDDDDESQMKRRRIDEDIAGMTFEIPSVD